MNLAPVHQVQSAGLHVGVGIAQDPNAACTRASPNMEAGSVSMMNSTLGQSLEWHTSPSENLT